MQQLDIAVFSSRKKVENWANVILPPEFKDGKYHITNRFDGLKEYMTIQQEDNYHWFIPDRMLKRYII